MILILTIRLRDKRCKSLSFRAPTLEAGLDIVNSIYGPDEQLLSVYLVEAESVTELPVDAFDRTAFAAPMHELASEWRTLLAGPTTKRSKPKRSRSTKQTKWAAVATQERIDLLLEQAELMEARLVILATTLARLEALYWQASSVLGYQQFIPRLFQSQIVMFEQQKRRADDHYVEVVSQLNKLFGM